jgi:hypothetical protein
MNQIDLISTNSYDVNRRIMQDKSTIRVYFTSTSTPEIDAQTFQWLLDKIIS